MKKNSKKKKAIQKMRFKKLQKKMRKIKKQLKNSQRQIKKANNILMI